MVRELPMSRDVAAVDGPGDWELRRWPSTLNPAAGEPAGRPRRDLVPVRKVRAPQGRVVGNADPG